MPEALECLWIAGYTAALREMSLSVWRRCLGGVNGQFRSPTMFLEPGTAREREAIYPVTIVVMRLGEILESCLAGNDSSPEIRNCTCIRDLIL